MPNFPEMQADLQALHETIDQEAPLQEIRIAALRVLTRHRFFTREILEATGDWEPRMQKEERDRQHEKFCIEHKSELQRLVKEPNGVAKVGKFLLENVPALPKEIRERADQPIGLFLKYIVHRIASVTLRDRDEEAGEHWERETRSFDIEMENKEKAQEFIQNMSPENREDFLNNVSELMEDAEPGEDWVEMDEVVSSDESFEENRLRVLRKDAQELELYMMIFDRRLKFGKAYSGLDLINERDVIPDPQEKPDWEPDNERDKLIQSLEELTGKSFKSDTES